MIEILIMILIAAVIVISFLSTFLQHNAEQTRKRYAIQPGKITYSDLDKPAKPLFSRKNLIVGKPDYIVKQEDMLIPVEVKSGYHHKPFKSHIMQLATYCQLIEDINNIQVPYGVIVYDGGKQFRITFDENLRSELNDTMQTMRSMIKNNDYYRNHNESNRCLRCSMREKCTNHLI